MIDLLILIVITSIALYGSKVTWQEGMIAVPVKRWLDVHLSGYIMKCELFPEHGVHYTQQKECRRYRIGRYLSKPLYACPACMASIWGSIIYSLNMSSTWNIGEMVLFDFATCGLTWILMWQFPFDD